MGNRFERIYERKYKKKSLAVVGCLMYPDWNEKEQLEQDETGNYNIFYWTNVIIFIFLLTNATNV